MSARKQTKSEARHVSRISCGEFAVLNGTVILPDRLIPDGMVRSDGTLIRSVGRRRRIAASIPVIDARGGYISPGFVDLHVHGGAGADFMDGTPESVQTACLAHARCGTTTIFPTTTTGPFSEIMAMIQACRTVARTSTDPQLPWIPGIHLYGPYFAEDKVGCHAPTGRREPQASEYRSYFDTRMIRIATCAAELEGASAFYARARRHRCLLTCGHSNSSWSEMQAAFDAGVRHVDHFWCAMSSVPSIRQRLGVPMQGSMAEFVLLNREMSTEVIADGCHLSPELLEFAWRMLGPERLCLVTDCNRALEMPPGDYIFGHHLTGTLFRSDGRVGWAPNGSLASSVQGMDHMVRTMAKATSASLPQIIRMASLTPAERAGIDDRTGSLAVGKRSDIVILDKNLAVQQTIPAGQ